MRARVRRIVTRGGATLALLALVALGCRSLLRRGLSPTRGYILISIDTLRADHLGAYGYARATSPFLDSLAGRGVLFENAFAQIPSTLPSHMSMFTGLYPGEHGVYPPDHVLAPDIPTLPEVFRRRGFATGGHTEGGYVHGGYGFARGFDEFSHEAEHLEDDAGRTFARGLAFLRRVEKTDRFFLFLHTYAVHDPYFPFGRYEDLYWRGDPPDTFPATGPNLLDFNRGKKKITPEALEYYKACYDASINYVDDVLRDFFSGLEALGLDDEVTVIVTSDHGEEFLEHGKMAHQQLYRESLHVPLVVLHPDLRRGKRVRSLVQTIDLAPTLFALAGIDPGRSLSGRSLLPLLVGKDDADGTEAYGESYPRYGRTLLRGESKSVYQLVQFEPPGDARTGAWVEGSVSIDVLTREIELEARSYHERRTLYVGIDGKQVATVALRPDRWAPVNVTLPDRRLTRLLLVSQTCTSPARLGGSSDTRCLSFELRGQPMARFELFDTGKDPAEQTNLADREYYLLTSLVKRLRTYDHRARATSQAKGLDPELEEQLRALGYVQ
jgi:arylsulfatase A-like enzyme